jgi:hypothetical protein
VKFVTVIIRIVGTDGKLRLGELVGVH